MKNVLVLCKKELRSYFYSPIAYVIITIFLLVAGYFFQNILSVYTMISFNAMRNQYMAQGLNFTDGIFRPLFGTSAS